VVVSEDEKWWYQMAVSAPTTVASSTYEGPTRAELLSAPRRSKADVMADMDLLYGDDTSSARDPVNIRSIMVRGSITKFAQSAVSRVLSEDEEWWYQMVSSAPTSKEWAFSGPTQYDLLSAPRRSKADVMAEVERLYSDTCAARNPDIIRSIMVRTACQWPS
jgi:hypothetical protein